MYPALVEAGDAGMTEFQIAALLHQLPTKDNINNIRLKLKSAKISKAPIRIKSWLPYQHRHDDIPFSRPKIYGFDPVWVAEEGENEPHPHQDKIDHRSEKRSETLRSKKAGTPTQVSRRPKLGYRPSTKFPEDWDEQPWRTTVPATGSKLPIQPPQDRVSLAMFNMVKIGGNNHADDNEADGGEHAS